MNIAELVSDLESAGIQLWEDGGQLRFRAPKGEMAPERRALLRANKAALLDFLSAGKHVEVTAHPAERNDPFPLTDVQSAYLLGRSGAFAYGGVSCHAYGELTLDELVPVRLQEAWNRLIQRHDMLRAVVDVNGYQRVLDEVPALDLTVHDLRGRGADEVRNELERVRAEMDHRTHEPGEWPLFELRATLLDEQAILHVSIDFLIADYVSIYLLLEELQMLHRDPAAKLHKPSVTFRDYLIAERSLRQGQRYERDRQYWLQRIDELPGAPELPLLDNPTKTGPARFRRYELKLGAGEWSALQDAAARQTLTPSAVVLAVYAEIIARWSRQARFTLDLTLLNRLPLHPDIGRIVGDFTSVELLAVEHDRTATFTERAKALARQLFDDLDHRLYSGVAVLRELARRRGSEDALMPVVFTSAIGLGGNLPDWELTQGVSQTPQVWIDCQAMETAGGLRVNWDVRQGVLHADAIDAMFAAFESLLFLLATSETAWHAIDPVELPAEQQDRRQQVNSTSAPIPDLLLHEGVFTAARRAPDRPAVIAQNHEPITFGELAGRAHAVAGWLRARGCRQGQLVGVVMDKGWEQVAAVFGVLLTGAAYLPVDAHQPEQRRKRILDDGVDLILTQSWSSPRNCLPAGCSVLDVDLLAPVPAPAQPPARQCAPGDLAYVIYTSGSTGVPKGVMITHRSAVNTVAHISTLFGVGAEDRVLCLANLGFDLSVYDMFGVLAEGGCLVIPDPERRSDPSHWTTLAREHQATIWNTVPAQLHMLSEFLRTEKDLNLPTLRLALLSGDWIPVGLPDQIRSRLPGLQLISLGGATEASIWSIYHPIETVSAEWHSIPYGKPLPNQRFHVLDANLRPCPDWVPGELFIGGEGLALGYLGDPEKTTERFIVHRDSGERLYRTGDLGRYRSDGEIEFLGRQDHQVKIRGHRIELAEVEAAIQANPAITSAAVIVAGKPPLGRYLVAFAEIARCHGAPALDVSNLTSHVQATVEEISSDVDVRKVVEFAQQLDATALLVMMNALGQSALFASRNHEHTMTAIMAAASVADRHQRLVRRWLNALEQNGLLARGAAGGFVATRTVTRDEVAGAWAHVHELLPAADDRAKLVEYFEHAARHLPELLRGEQDPVQLLFPEGSVEIQEAAYNEGFLSRYLNRVAVSTLRWLADRCQRRLRVLEVGAGVGGTSIDAIAALIGSDVSYLFTDVSQFFLNKAGERFGHLPWVDYALYDMNADYRAQGMQPNSFDVILCGNVMHYARDAAKVLASMRELLVPGGWLIFIETTRDNYQILTSMEFLFDATVGDFEDVRKGKDQTFIAADQWRTLLSDSGGEIVYQLPELADVLSSIGMYVFAARFKTDRSPIDVPRLADSVSEHLPADMLPAQYQLIDEMPLNENGKIDRKRLAEWEVSTGDDQAIRVTVEPETYLERQVAAIWASVLGVPGVGREQDFYEMGGDSLLAAQVVVEMREQIPEARAVFFDELLRGVLTRATVAAICATLDDASRHEENAQESGDQRSATVVLHGNPDGGSLTVLVREGFGSEGYVALRDALAERGPVAELTVAGGQQWQDGEPDGRLIERLVDEAAAVLNEHGFLSVEIIGAHFGGVLAVELAGRLVESGVEVGDVAIISSFPLPAVVDDEGLADYLFVRATGLDPAVLGFPADHQIGRALAAVLRTSPGHVPTGALTDVRGDNVLDSVAAAFRAWSARTGEERLSAIADALNADVAAVRERMTAARALAAAMARHEPSAYAGDVSLFRDKEGTPLWPSLHQDMAEYWHRHVLGAMNVVDIPGDHFDCIGLTRAADLADTIIIERRQAAR